MNNCNQSCKKINTELDLINCLDNCAANADNKIPIYKIFTLGMVVILGFILATRYIDLIYLKKDKYYLKKIDDICSFFSDKKKIDNEYDFEEGTAEYEQACEITNQWAKIMDKYKLEPSNHIVDLLYEALIFETKE